MGSHRLIPIFESRCEQHYEITRNGQPVGRMLCAIARSGRGWQVLTTADAGETVIRLKDKAKTRYDVVRVRRQQRQAAVERLNQSN